MAQLPNPYADQSTATLAQEAVEAGHIPVACPECGAVSSRSAEQFTRVMSSQSITGFGQCEPCGVRFVPVNSDGDELDPAEAGWSP